ncbi:MAG: alanine racemase [Gammaproteobacteria bacterium]|nr:alanine racemase [Gammaproteobacteria bacterium]
MRNIPVARIDLAAIQANLDLARRCAPRSRIMAVVKADAYGHGAVEVSRALQGVDALCVARIDEGVTLRAAGIDTPILLLEGIIDGEELEAARIERLTPVLHSTYQTELVKGSRHKDIAVWLKVDTGMHRLGFSVEEFRHGMTTGADLNVVGVMSHLANADDPENQENINQARRVRRRPHTIWMSSFQSLIPGRFCISPAATSTGFVQGSCFMAGHRDRFPTSGSRPA